jgi:hypothetical protein
MADRSREMDVGDHFIKLCHPSLTEELKLLYKIKQKNHVFIFFCLRFSQLYLMKYFAKCVPRNNDMPREQQKGLARFT